MTLEQVTAKIAAEYERAKALPYIRNPLAYAIHQVWKEADRLGRIAGDPDLYGKCGSCRWAKPAHVFGSSTAYFECTNKEHNAKWCRHDVSKYHSRTGRACKQYQMKEKNDE